MRNCSSTMDVQVSSYDTHDEEYADGGLLEFMARLQSEVEKMIRASWRKQVLYRVLDSKHVSPNRGEQSPNGHCSGAPSYGQVWEVHCTHIVCICRH